MDQEAKLGWYYVIVGNDGSNLGLARFLGVLAAVLVLAFLIIQIALG